MSRVRSLTVAGVLAAGAVVAVPGFAAANGSTDAPAAPEEIPAAEHAELPSVATEAITDAGTPTDDRGTDSNENDEATEESESTDAVTADQGPEDNHGADVSETATTTDPGPEHGPIVAEEATDNHGQATASEARADDTETEVDETEADETEADETEIEARAAHDQSGEHAPDDEAGSED